MKINKTILTSVLFLILLSINVFAANGNFTQPTSAPQSASNGGGTLRDGIVFTASQSTILYKMEKFTSATCSIAYLTLNGSSDVLAQANFNGHIANFSYALTAGTSYIMRCDAGGAGYTRAWNGAPSYPYAGTHGSMTGNIVDGGFGTGHYMNIRNITTDNSTLPDTITLTLHSPLNFSYTSDTTPQFDFNATSVLGNWNATLIINNTAYQRNNSITTAKGYSIVSSELSSGEYLWWINATNNADGTTIISDKRYIYVIGDGPAPSSSCVVDLGRAYFRPNNCGDI